MKTKLALHRAQNLDKEMVRIYEKEELKNDVSAYLEMLQIQLDAQEDGDMYLASAIGRSMRQLRQKHDAQAWGLEMKKAGINDY